jgi:hypothetical protein
MRALLLFALLFLSLFSFAYLDPPIKEVTDFNNALAPSLMHFKNNYGGVPESAPSFDNPVAFYDVEVLDALPSVDGMVSSNHPPAVLWAWGERHGDSFHKVVPGDPRCSDTVVDRDVGEPEPKKFNAMFETGSKVKEVNLWSGGFINPGPNPFSSKELELAPYFDKPANKTLFPFLKVTVYGEVEYPVVDKWMFSDYVCRVVCSEGSCAESCSCEPRSETHYSSIKISASSTKSFLLEGGNVSSFLAMPVLKEQTDFEPKALLFTFSNRRIYKYYLVVDGKLMNASYGDSFSVTQDPYGARHIGIVEGNFTGPQTGDPDLPALSGENNTMQWLRNQSFETPVPLVEANETFSYVHVFMHNYSGLLGKRKFEFRFYDCFHDAHPHYENITTRRPVSLVLSTVRKDNTTEEITVRLADRFGNRIPGQAVEVRIDGALWRTFVTDASGEAQEDATLGTGSHAIDAKFRGSESYMTASDSQSLYYSSGFALKLDAFGPLLVLLALFSGVAYASTGRVPGTGFLTGAWRLFAFMPATKLVKPKMKNNTMHFGGVGVGTVTGEGGGGNAPEAATATEAGTMVVAEEAERQKAAVKPMENKQLEKRESDKKERKRKRKETAPAKTEPQEGEEGGLGET